jgi:tetratricopeptide (TPR) repeat protein
MSIPINSKGRFFWTVLYVVICVSFLSLGYGSRAESQVDKKVIEAYEMRMQGKADEARAQLEQFLTENPNDAPAHYELARTKYQMGLSNPREMMTVLEDMQQTIEQAIKNDPDNVIYPFFAGHIAFMSAFVALQGNQSDAKEKVAKLCSVYDSVLKLKPDYKVALLYLVEIYANLPEEMGGDKLKAEQYAKKLEEMDKIYGAKARAILMPEDADYVGYWKSVLEEHEGNIDVIVDLGRAYLLKGEAEDGVDCYEKALKIDPTINLLLLDLARYYGMRGLRDETLREASLPLSEKMYRRYLETEPILPLKAFATRQLANLKRIMGDKEEAEKLFAEAEAIDPFVSKAFGVPTLDLFIPVREISHKHRYHFTPF